MRKIYSLFLALICIFCLSIPAFAYSPYTTPSISGTSPYQTPTSSGYDPGLMPGSGSPFSGSTYIPSNAGYVPGIGYGPNGESGSGGGGTAGGGTGDHFGASVSSDGSISISLPGATGVSGGDPTSAIALMFQKYKTVGAGIIGICVITAILSLLLQITKLGAAGSNERLRANALRGIIVSGAVLSVFGALGLVVGIFWNAFV